MLSWQIFVTDIILFDGILAEEKYITPFGAFQQRSIIEFFCNGKNIYKYMVSVNRARKMVKWESFFNILIFFIKARLVPTIMMTGSVTA